MVDPAVQTTSPQVTLQSLAVNTADAIKMHITTISFNPHCCFHAALKTAPCAGQSKVEKMHRTVQWLPIGTQAGESIM